jgi:pyruvate/2-oxoglutarate dehydrogenase complex dihydrolipoamide acyltransferase (E2) component
MMKRTLQSIAAQLSEDEINQLIKIKKMGGKKSAALLKKRDKLAAQLAAVEAELARLSGGKVAPSAQPKRRGRKPAAAKAAKTAKAAAPAKKTAGRKKKAAGSRRINFSASVREVFTQAGTPLKASQVVDGLPGVGVKVKDISDMRKRVSVVLAQHKNHFEQVERGVYRLRGE